MDRNIVPQLLGYLESHSCFWGIGITRSFKKGLAGFAIDFPQVFVGSPNVFIRFPLVVEGFPQENLQKTKENQSTPEENLQQTKESLLQSLQSL